MKKKITLKIERLFILAAGINFLYTSILWYNFWNGMDKYNSNGFFYIQNEKNEWATLIITILFGLIAASFKTLILLKLDKKYISIPMEKRKIISIKSKKEIFILTVLLLSMILLTLLFPSLNNGFAAISSFSSVSIAVGFIIDSFRLDDVLDSISEKKVIDSENNEEIQSAAETFFDNISDIHHNF